MFVAFYYYKNLAGTYLLIRAAAAVTPEESYERIKLRSRSCESTIPMEYLTRLHGAYEDFLEVGGGGGGGGGGGAGLGRGPGLRPS